jgi:hypothetical protein
MMIAMDVEVSIAANSTNENTVRDQQYQTAPFSGFLLLRDTGSAAGLRRTLNVGGTSVLDRGVVNSNNRVPQDPDDNVIKAVEVFAGQQIFLPVQNTTGGALTYRARLELEAADEQ